MKTEDESRKWMWMFLATLVLLQMYFVWELLAVFLLFAVGFAAIAFVTGSLYISASGFRASPLMIDFMTFWPWPEHTQSLSPCLLQD